MVIRFSLGLEEKCIYFTNTAINAYQAPTQNTVSPFLPLSVNLWLFQVTHFCCLKVQVRLELSRVHIWPTSPNFRPASPVSNRGAVDHTDRAFWALVLPRCPTQHIKDDLMTATVNLQRRESQSPKDATVTESLKHRPGALEEDR